MTLKKQIEYWKHRAEVAENIVAKLRSPKWPSVRRKHLQRESACAACGTKQSLNVHHVIAFHDDKTLELVDSNLITLCESKEFNCHLEIGHDGSWHRINSKVREEAAVALDKVKGKS